MIDWEQFKFTAHDGTHPFAKGGMLHWDPLALFNGGGQGSCGSQLPHGAAIFKEREGDVWMRKSRKRQVMVDVGVFGFFGPKEFSPSGEVEKDLAYLDRSAGRAPGGFDFNDLAAVNHDLRRSVGIVLARGNRHAADAGDARDGFAAKSHRGDGRKVFGLLDFAGGMAFEGKQRIVAVHAATVISDTN